LLSAGEGIAGDTASTVSGSIGTSIILQTDANGAALVSATSPLEAVRLALAGEVQVSFQGATYTYYLSPGSSAGIGDAVSDHKPFLFNGTQLWLEDLAGSGTCDWDYNDHKWFVEVTEHTPTTGSGYGDLDILDSTNAAVSEAKETAVGGWVPLNNDNDNYNFQPNNALSHITDKDESVKVEGEDDLVPIQVTLPTGVSAWWLTFEESGIRLWESADKDGRYTSGTPRPANGNLTLWVEGYLPDYHPRQHKIQLRTRIGYYNTHLADEVKLSVYQVNGAMNVPGYSRHTYQAIVPDSTPRFAAGNAALGVTPANPVASPNTPTTSRTAEVYWDAGAVVGTYKVYPTADDNFYVTRQVNVVKVEFTLAETANVNQITFSGPPVQSVEPHVIPANVNPRLITSSVTGAAMRAKLRVTKIEGALVAGARRGARFIEAGMIQNGTFTKMRSEDTDLRGGPVVAYASSLEGNTYLDCVTDVQKTSVKPWYDSKELTGDRGIYPRVGEEVTDTPPADIDFNVSDTPRLLGTNREDFQIFYEGNSDEANTFVIQFNLRLYFALRTKEASLGSEEVYTQRGMTVWHFDGSGRIANTVWTKLPGVGNGTGTAAGADQGASFAAITDGTKVPLTSAHDLANKKLANEALAGEDWS
jgi:hypothetical protein